MKTLYQSLFLCTILLLLTANLKSYGQEIPIDIIDRVNAVDYIFEGEVIKSTPYKTANGRYIYTSNTIEISKILKGNLKCGTIELITDGGIVDDHWVDRSHSLNLTEKCKGIFLATNTGKELSSVDFYDENNLQKIEATFQNQSFIKYWHDGVEWRISDLWANYDSLIQVYNLAELITGLNFKDCERSSLFENDNEEHEVEIAEKAIVMPIYDPAEFEKLKNYVAHKKREYTKQNNSRDNDKVFYELENFIISGSTTKFLEFDVTIRDNLGTGYLDLSAIRIVYDTDVFGSNIVSNSNIETTRGTINSNSNCYADPFPSDLAPNAFYVWALETTYSQCKEPILTTPQKLMHLKMRIQDCAVPSNIQLLDTATFFDPSLILGLSAYSAFPADTFSTFYTELQHLQTTPVPACVPTITSFTPSTVAGGILDELEIRGFQFGAVRGNGTVFFKNANDGGTTEVACDAGDFLSPFSWTDTLIQLYVPSVDTAIIQGVAVPHSPAGSGYFRVVTNDALSATSPEPINISYSVVANASTTPKSSAFLATTPNQNGQYIFHIDTLVAAYQNGAMIPVIKKALHEWTCLTGIDWVLASETNFTTQPGPQLDSICTITFANLGTNIGGATQLALNTSQRKPCPPFFYTIDSDIQINNDPDIIWFIDTIPTSPIPAGQNDLYFALLHELGHAHNMQHLISPNDIMHFADNTAGSFRKIELYLDQPAYDGGNWVMDKSFQYPVSGTSCNMSDISSISSPICSNVTAVVDSKSENSISLYPNPFYDQLTIVANGQYIRSVSIIDISGKAVAVKTNIKYNTSTLDLSKLDNGIYIIKTFLQDGSTGIAKAIKSE